MYYKAAAHNSQRNTGTFVSSDHGENHMLRNTRIVFSKVARPQLFVLPQAPAQEARLGMKNLA